MPMPTPTPRPETSAAWPAIPYPDWQDTCATLHRWTQIVGKTRLALEPRVNHWWGVTLYVSARGLTTGAMPFGGGRVVEVEFDLLGRELAIATGEGARRTLALRPRSVADFYAEYRGALAELGVPAHIWGVPVELSDALPFADDTLHASYDGEAAERFWRALVEVERLFKVFRARFLGKSSPPHFFWGSFDLAVTRFSGRAAPPHPGGIPNVGDWVMREAYSHEVSSAGFWPGNPSYPQPALYAYAYPAPAAFGDQPVSPAGAFYSRDIGEFILPYETVRTAADPDVAVLDFLQSTYEAAANLAAWDRAALERAG